MRVAVAMSGGVDSSTVFRMLHDEGHEVFGITMRHLPKAMAPERVGSCCSPGAVAAAARLAGSLDRAHYVFDLEDRFASDVMKPTALGLARGITPNPCVICNERVKFDALFARAIALGAEAFATGHYARLLNGRLLRARDFAKDQSYFLYRVPADARARSMFPLGALAKSEVRDRAKSYGLEMHDKPDSVDVCFAPGGDFHDAIDRFAPVGAVPGDFVSRGGVPLGRHKGVGFYTVGQRRGVGVASSERMYVEKIDPVRNEITLGPRAGLDLLTATDVVLHQDLPGTFSATARIRSQHKGVGAKVAMDSGRIELRVDEPQFGVTPGQSVVLYEGELVLGGGIIISDVHGKAAHVVEGGARTAPPSNSPHRINGDAIS